MLTAAQKTKIRKAIVDYTTRAEGARLHRSYSQQRPGHGYMLQPEAWQYDDCSMYISKVYNWAMHVTGIYLHDPIDGHYTGMGYTGTAYDYLKHHRAPENKYLIGDINIWGTTFHTQHTDVCRKAGTDKTAIFSSHGHQSYSFARDAPNNYTIEQFKRYVGEGHVGTFRHPALL